MSLPLGFIDSLARADDRLDQAQKDLKGLHDLLKHDGVPESELIFVKRKHGLIGHLRNDLAELPDRLERA